MSEAECKPEGLLEDVASQLKTFEQQITVLTERAEAWVVEIGVRLDRLEQWNERALMIVPMEAQAWEEQLPMVVGTLLSPALVPVCARLLVGMRAKQIAAELRRPLTTVKSQITVIRERLNVASSEEIPLSVFRRFWETHSSPKAQTPQRNVKG